MGRSQVFATDQAVSAALEVFWREGYESASIPELERASGLNRSSIYHAFGSKRGLFDAAIQHYLNHAVRPLLGELRSPTPAPDALAAYFDRLNQALSDQGSLAGSHGCLLVNTSRSPLARDPQIAAQIRNYLSEVELAFTRGLAVRDRSTSAPGLSARTLLALVLAAFSTVRVDHRSALDFISQARESLS